jgi:hypothetical protein
MKWTERGRGWSWTNVSIEGLRNTTRNVSKNSQPASPELREQEAVLPSTRLRWPANCPSSLFRRTQLFVDSARWSFPQDERAAHKSLSSEKVGTAIPTIRVSSRTVIKWMTTCKPILNYQPWRPTCHIKKKWQLCWVRHTSSTELLFSLKHSGKYMHHLL